MRLGATLAVLILLATAGPAVSQPPPDAGNPAGGRALIDREGCLDCHDPDDGDALVPRLCGQKREYLFKQLTDIRWASKGVLGGRWAPVAGHDLSRLTPGDLSDIAAVYAACSCTAPETAEAPRPKIANRCVFCHREGAAGDRPNVPILATQKAAYLERQLNQFQKVRKRIGETGNGAQRSNPIMDCQAGLLTPEQIRAVSAWYAGLPCRSNGPSPR